MIHTDESAALVASVLTSPADDLPRLVYADWLEEHGEPEWAEFIRGQIWAPISPCRAVPASLLRVVCDLIGRRTFDVAKNWSGVNGSNVEFHDGTVMWVRRGFVAEVECEAVDWYGRECRYCTDGSADWETGIVECRQCDSTGIDAQGRFGPGIVQVQPVERVQLLDRAPGQASQVYPNGGPPFGWSHYDIRDDREDELTTEVWGRLRGGWIVGGWRYYHTAEDAVTALSNCLIAWAKDA